MSELHPDDAWGEESGPPPEETTFCFFELEGTLVRRKTAIPFLLGWLRRHPLRLWRILAVPFRLLACIPTRKDRPHLAESLLMASMRRARPAAIDAYVPAFWEWFLSAYRSEEIANRLLWHHERGHRVFIATRALDFYAAYLMRLWPVDGVIATRTEWRDGVLTGRIAGEVCRGVDKMRRIERELGLSLQEGRYYAYSGDESDIPLLMSTEYGFLVRVSTISRWEREPA